MNYLKNVLLGFFFLLRATQLESAIIEFSAPDMNKKILVEAIKMGSGHYFIIYPSDGLWYSSESKKGIVFSVRYFDNFGKLMQYKARIPLVAVATNGGKLIFQGIDPLSLDVNRKPGIAEELKYVSYFMWDTVSSLRVERVPINNDLNIDLFNFCFLNSQLFKVSSNSLSALKGYSLYCGVQKEHKVIWTRFNDDTLILSLNSNTDVTKLIFRYFSNFSIGDYIKDSFVFRITSLPVSINSCREVFVYNYDSSDSYEVGFNNELFNNIGVELDDFFAANPINMRVYGDWSMVYFPNFDNNSSKSLVYSVDKNETHSPVTVKYYIGRYLFWSRTFEFSSP